LQHIEGAFDKRVALDVRYRELLRGVTGVSMLDVPGDIDWNHAYFPVRIGPDYPLSRDGIYDLLKQHGIMSRRYFYPLISSFPMYRGLASAAKASLPQANLVADEILCLPIFPDLDFAEQQRIVDIIKSPMQPAASSWMKPFENERYAA
jgi:dTDP-4-amino-4,6-dideoxygalactose transaminase